LKTLLRLFYIPYLRFLAKFHLIALPLIILSYVLRLEELMVLVPMMYPFALYTTINRHQFKDNIPWMLATFNKRTLIRYHLVSQTLVMFLLALLSSVVVLATTIATITLLPKASEAPERGMNGKALDLIATHSFDWMSTKEQCLLVIAAVFFLTTLYSPVALKEHLRQMEEGADKWKKWRWPMVFGLLAILLTHGAGLKLTQLTLPLLATLIVGQWIYLVNVYNKAFTLYHPRLNRRLWQGGAVAALCLSVGLGQLSLHRIRTSPSADQRVAEMAFLGTFAPRLNDQQMVALLKDVKDPSAAVELFGEHRQIPLAVKGQWLKSAQEFGVALQVIQTLQDQELQLLNRPDQWAQLDRAYQKLYASNPAAANWRLMAFNRHLKKHHWRPATSTADIGQRPMLEQVVLLEHLRQHHKDHYVQVISKPGLSPQALDIHLERAPASQKP